jgi:hypothetical protein
MDCGFAAVVLSSDTVNVGQRYQQQAKLLLDSLNAGRDLPKQIREKVYFTAGRIFANGKKTARGNKRLLMSDNLPNNSPDASKELLICTH